jgi:hypothetical protein
VIRASEAHQSFRTLAARSILVRSFG